MCGSVRRLFVFLSIAIAGSAAPVGAVQMYDLVEGSSSYGSPIVYGGPYVFDMTVWFVRDAYVDPSPADPLPRGYDLLDEELEKSSAPGIMVDPDDGTALEHGWGLFRIDRIYKGQWADGQIQQLSGKLWDRNLASTELVGMISELYDLYVTFNGDGTQTVESTSPRVELFEQASGHFTMAGAGVRDTTTGAYPTLDGNLVFSGYGMDGFVGTDGAIVAAFDPNGTGVASMYVSILSGLGQWEQFDGDAFTAPDESATADILFNITFSPLTWTQFEGQNASGTMVPEPASLGLLALGAAALLRKSRKIKG